MFRKILVCTDLSAVSDSLIRCAGELKTVGMEEAVLTHVIYVAHTPGLEEMLAEEARTVLERQKATLAAQGVKVTVEMPLGLPARTLNETAEKHGVCAILIGSHGKGMLRSATLGSVSSKLIHQTRRPILLARTALVEGEKSLPRGRLFSNILFPTDFSETAEHALEHVGRIASEAKSRVTLLYVCEHKQLDAESRQWLENGGRFLAEAKRERLKSRGVSEVSVELTCGDPAGEIIDRADKGGFSLIVMGSQGKGFVREVFLGTVSNEVARHAVVPVLLIPAPR